MTAAPTWQPGPAATIRRIGTTTRVLWRVQRSRGRLALALVVTAVLGLAAVAAGVAGGGRGVAATLLEEAGLGLAFPIVSLVFAVACLGEPRDDGTLVYVWLRPVRRSEIAFAAWLAATGVAVPLTALTVAAVAVASGHPGLLPAGVVAVTLATAGYVALFVALGLRTNRSLLWGFGYVLLLEGFLVRFSEQLAAVSVRRYAASVFRDLAGTSGPDLYQVSLPAGVTGLVATTAVGIALTAWWLRSRPVP